MSPKYVDPHDLDMGSQSEAERVYWLLSDLCSQLGYSMAVREPERFERLVAEGVEAFADAVLEAEGLAPELNKGLRRDVRAFVAKRFEKWRGA